MQDKFVFELKENSALANSLDKYIGTHKFEVVPVYESPREKLIKAIKDLTPDEIEKVKVYVEFLRYRRTHKQSY